MKYFFETWKDFFRSFKAQSLAAKLSIVGGVFVCSLIISLGLSDFWFSINSEVPSPKQLLLFSLIGLLPVMVVLTVLFPVMIKEIKKIRLWYFLFPLVILIITIVYYPYQKVDFLLNTSVLITTDISSKDEPICFYDIRNDAEQEIVFYSDRSKKEYCGNYKGYPIRADKSLTVIYDGAFGEGYFPLVSYKGQLPAKMSLCVSSSLVPNISQNFDYTFTPASGNILQITGISQYFHYSTTEVNDGKGNLIPVTFLSTVDTIIRIIVSLILSVFYSVLLFALGRLFLSQRMAVKATILSAVFIICLGMFLVRNINDPAFWFDESGQFWIAKGLNHGSPPLSQDDNGLDQVLSANRSFNLDPGGFSILLHYWTMIGNSPMILRTLPVLFFICTILVSTAIAILATGGNLIVSLVAGSVPILSPVLLHYAFELRPISMESLGTSLSALILFLLAVRPEHRFRLTFLCGVVCALFMTSRYGFLIIAITCGVIIVVDAFFSPQGITNRIKQIALFVLPVAAAAIFIYLFAYQYQRLQTGPLYVEQYMLADKSLRDVFILIGKNILSPYYLPAIVFVITYFILNNRISNASDKRLLRYMYLFTILANSFVILASALGIYPWIISQRWNINIHTISFLSIVFFVSLLIKCNLLMPDWTFQYFKSERLQRVSRVLSIVLVCILYISVNYKLLTYLRCSPDFVHPFLKNIPEEKLRTSSFFVSYDTSPTVRYLFEYGPYKSIGRDIYPKNFDFYDEKKEKYDYIIPTNLVH